MKNTFNITLNTLLVILFAMSLNTANSQKKSNHGNKFEQLGPMLPSPNQYRNRDGAPGPDYWQQKADYVIECTLDTKNQRLDGKETITYFNQSPNALSYLWLQLDENEHSAEADKHKMEPSSINDKMSERSLRMLEPWRELEQYGHKIQKVTDAMGKPMEYSINKTMMRLQLPKPLEPGEKISFNIEWYYYLINRMNSTSWGRGGYEHFDDTDDYLYTIVQWFPRLCVYSDFEGWQNNQFTGRGEFALTFGDYKVKMTVPKDHMVGSTGECSNLKQMLSPTQWSRWQDAQTTKEPIEIVTLAEAKALEQSPKTSQTKTWEFHAENVRDFAWTASRKFVWDAMPHTNELGDKVMCMSYYGKEAYPIYSKYSTKATEHTLEVYSKYSIPYPYPVAISVEAANGMEYPMICFNPGRAEKDGTYLERQKLACILVVIHEVGHNYFPMIINSDERQWAWFDEGINSFMQFVAEQEWNNKYKHSFVPYQIADYMSQPPDNLEPIMTNTENIINYGANAYSKPAAALNILRETVMGRELFDYAFKEYCRRWAFKHPTPADFFRTMEDASGIDLDWFWKGWFYSIDYVDISLDSIKWYKVDLENNPESKESTRERKLEKPFEHISQIRNREAGIEFANETDTSLVDFYTNYEPWNTEDSIAKSTTILYAETFSEEEKKDRYGSNNYYELSFSNKGGLVMPVILEWEYEDGTKEMERIPVEIWRKNENNFTKVFVKDKVVKGIVVDPYRETADADLENNNWPVKEVPTRFQVFKKHKQKEQLNPMQKAIKKKRAIRP